MTFQGVTFHGFQKVFVSVHKVQMLPDAQVRAEYRSHVYTINRRLSVGSAKKWCVSAVSALCGFFLYVCLFVPAGVCVQAHVSPQSSKAKASDRDRRVSATYNNLF